MNLKFNVPPGQWIKATDLYQALMAKALTGAMRDVGKLGRERGRQAITAAGFSNKFANSLVAKLPAKDTLAPTAYIHTTINYADVFETGAVIVGKNKAGAERVFARQLGEGKNAEGVAFAHAVEHASGLKSAMTECGKSIDGQAPDRFEQGCRVPDGRTVFRQAHLVVGSGRQHRSRRSLGYCMTSLVRG